MKVERNILNKKNLAELENLVNRLDVAVDHSMKDYFKLVEEFLQYLREMAWFETEFDRDFCVRSAAEFNSVMNSELGKIRIGKFHGYQEWVGIEVVTNNKMVLFWADFEVKPDEVDIKIDLDKDNFKVLPIDDLQEKMTALYNSFDCGVVFYKKDN